MPFQLPDWFLEIPSTTPLVVGVSGGRDSIALLHLLIDSGYDQLLVAHVNHGLRGEESDADEAFVIELCDRVGLQYQSTKVDVAERSQKEKKSIEHSARLARHEHFLQCTKSSQTRHIVLAHHGDDQAETILFNLLRGSAGLKGMKPKSELKINGQTLSILRPLLERSRKDIDAYISKHSLSYREDSSNAKDFATRNRLRNEALPLLAEIMQRDISESLIRAHQWQLEQRDALDTLLEEKNVLDPQGRIHLPSFSNLPVGAQRSFLHSYLSHHGITDLSQDLIRRCLGIIETDAPAKTNLPGGKHLCRKEQRLFIR